MQYYSIFWSVYLVIVYHNLYMSLRGSSVCNARSVSTEQRFEYVNANMFSVYLQPDGLMLCDELITSHQLLPSDPRGGFIHFFIPYVGLQIRDKLRERSGEPSFRQHRRSLLLSNPYVFNLPPEKFAEFLC